MTPEQKQCGRCQRVIPTDGWEHRWPLYGKIVLGCPAQSFAFLAGARGTADKEHFAVWKEGHPAITRFEAQHVEFVWGNGDEFESEFRLCYQCQHAALRVIGAFFGMDKRAEEIAQSSDEEELDKLRIKYPHLTIEAKK